MEVSVDETGTKQVVAFRQSIVAENSGSTPSSHSLRTRLRIISSWDTPILLTATSGGLCASPRSKKTPTRSSRDQVQIRAPEKILALTHIMGILLTRAILAHASNSDPWRHHSQHATNLRETFFMP